MNKKITGMFLLVLLMATPALAAIAVTINTPIDGVTYNNLPSNASNVDVNFLVTDNNADVLDHNINIKIYNADWSLNRNLRDDMNVRSVDPAVTCSPVTSSSLLDRYTCRVIWDFPENTSLGDGTYYIDVNVVSVGLKGASQLDTNANIQFQVFTKLATGDTLRSLMSIVGVILAALVLLGGLVAALAFKTDPAKTALITVFAAVAVAIAAQIIGVVMALV